MTTLFGPILATALLAQIHGGTIQGKVVDEQGKPVACAQVVCCAPLAGESKAGPTEVRTRTDAAGQFRLEFPWPRVAMTRAPVWAYRPGLAIAVVARNSLPASELVLRKPEPKAIKVEGPDSQPVAGVILSPQFIFAAGGKLLAAVPAPLATSLVVTTGPDGRSALDYLADGDQPAVVRVAAESIGSQALQVTETRRLDPQPTTVTIRLKPTSRLAGRVRNRAGQPVANQPVEVWLKPNNFPPNPVEFKNGPLRTAADGSFQTPDNLLVGSQYRVVIRTSGMEPILSDWITIDAQPRVMLPMIQRPLRSISGRVADRQSKPLANVEVFQLSEGPEPTTTKTGGDGRFVLGGFRDGPVFLFARSDGFRFFGRLIKPGDGEITVELTRTSERPAHEMRMLPEPVPLEESRALARRLIEPYWAAAVAAKDSRAAGRSLYSLAPADPVGVLQKLEASEIVGAATKSLIERNAARSLARTDPARAQEVAETIESPVARIAALVAVADRLPPTERDRKLAVLARAAIAAQAAKSPFQAAEVADRWLDLGEKEKAKALFAESVRWPKDEPRRRGFFAGRLARVDLPAALAIAKEFPANDRGSARGALWNIALHVAADNPAEAERVMRLAPTDLGIIWLPPPIAWKMATTDPARARRLVDEAQRYDDRPEDYFFLALGLKAHDPAAADEACRKAIQGIDRLMNEGVEYCGMRGHRDMVLPLVEQIDPALVSEVFWRVIATRPPTDDPRDHRSRTLSDLAMLLGWYDRQAAAALFEPVRALMDQTDDRQLAGSAHFVGWSIFDPRAAVARLEQVLVTSGLETRANVVRERVAEILGLSFEDRWQRLWGNNTEMGGLLERDF